MYTTADKKKPKAAAPTTAPFASPALAAAIRSLLASGDIVAPPACSTAVIQLLRRAGRTPEAPMCEALALAGRSLYYRWTRRRIDSSLARLRQAGAVARVGASYELGPALLSSLPRVAVPGECVEFVALSGKRHFYPERCAADLRGLYEVIGDLPVNSTHIQLVFEILGLDWSKDAVEATLQAMQLRDGPRDHREGLVKFDNPFALMDTVEGFIADCRRREGVEAA